MVGGTSAEHLSQSVAGPCNVNVGTFRSENNKRTEGEMYWEYVMVLVLPFGDASELTKR